MSDSAAGHIKATSDGFITQLSINNPSRRNAMTFSMWSELGNTLTKLADDDQTRVLVISGAGDKAFCAGNDISEFEYWKTDPARSAEYTSVSHAATTALREFPKPVIAAIKGFCIGGGLELALLGDIRLCVDDSKFAVTPARLGLGYDLNDTDLLVRRIGAASAREMLFTAAMYDAVEAIRLGVVSRAYTAAQFDGAVSDLASQIAQNAPLTVRASKAIVAEAEKPVEQRNTELCDSLVRACYESKDFTEGRTAFAAKRKPEFTGQ